jgi:hypothetical protein
MPKIERMSKSVVTTTIQCPAGLYGDAPLLLSLLPLDSFDPAFVDPARHGCPVNPEQFGNLSSTKVALHTIYTR